MLNFLEPEPSGPGSNSTDPVMAAINGPELVPGLRSANNLEFCAESPTLEGLMPAVEDGPGVDGPTTAEGADALTGASADGSEKVAREASAINPNAEEVHRFWDEQTESHFFTADEGEFEARLANSARYRYEGVEFEAPLASVGDALPVYRFENQTTGTYFYTLQSPEIITNDYPVLERDGIAFYAFSPNAASPSGTVPIYRFFNEGASAQTETPVHFFTGTEENKDNVIENYSTFTYEGSGWYAYGLERSNIDIEEFQPVALQTVEEEDSTGVAAIPGFEPEDEAGNSISTAKDLQIHAGRWSDEGYVSSNDTDDFYRFQVQYGGDIQLGLKNLSADADLRLLNSSGEDLVEPSNASGATDERITYDLVPNTDYFVRVNSYDGSGTEYELVLNLDEAGEDMNTALALDDFGGDRVEIREFLGKDLTDEFDYFKFNVDKPRWLRHATRDLSVDIDVEILDATGAPIERNDYRRENGFEEYADYQVRTPGTYYAKVTAPSESSDSTNYTLVLNLRDELPEEAEEQPSNDEGSSAGGSSQSSGSEVDSNDEDDGGSGSSQSSSDGDSETEISDGNETQDSVSQNARNDKGEEHIVRIQSIDGTAITNRPTWLVTHGNASNAENMGNLANAIKSNAPDYQVLTLDWSSATNQGSSDASSLRQSTPWIQPVARTALDMIDDLISRDNLNLIGHSLGAYVSWEIANQLNQGVPRIIALDPATQIPTGSYRTENIDFSTVSDSSWGFYGAEEGFLSFGSDVKTQTAQESFKLNFKGDTTADEAHGGVIDAFANILELRTSNDLFTSDDLFTVETFIHDFDLAEMGSDSQKAWVVDDDDDFEAEIDLVRTSEGWLPETIRLVV